MPRWRVLLPWVLAAAGAVALWLGWWGASGTALTAKQVPYLVSGGLTGVALVTVAAALFAADDIRSRLSRLSRLERLESRLETLLGLLTVDDEPPAEPAVPAVLGGLVAVDGGASYHRSSCRMVVGKAHVRAVSRDTGRGLAPCRLCDPPALSAA